MDVGLRQTELTVMTLDMIKLTDVEQGDVHHNKMTKTLTSLAKRIAKNI